MNLLRDYLQWYQHPTWLIYAARNQNLSVPNDHTVSPAHIHGCGVQSGVHSHPRDGHSFVKLLVVFLSLTSCLFLTAATQPPNHAYVLPGKIAAEWTFHGESRVWLEIHSANSRDWPEEGYNASFTFITVKDCVPVVRKLGDGRYEIAFRSEIAKDLP